jgi:thiamine biosynthesis lipoprotein ApbE
MAWKFTAGRKASMRKAQKVHQYLVKLGEKARAKGMKL